MIFSPLTVGIALNASRLAYKCSVGLRDQRVELDAFRKRSLERSGL
jgi:hypothetical protein